MMFLFRRFILVSTTNSRCKITMCDKIAELRLTMPKHRENPVIMKLESPEFKSLFTEELVKLIDMFKRYELEIRIAGGAVRDMLMGLKPKDVDFATTATPTEMKEMFKTENIRLINTNGEKHGTITPRINNENFEITTLRIDMVTDGRRAEVAFTKDWLLDSLRRDLTINSMFCGVDGLVYDYFFGYDDLQNRRVVFVGNPNERIQEDYLRILRYFRFYGRIAKEKDNHDESTIQAIKDNVEGLTNVSGERIWTELKKTLEGKFAGELLEKIVECGLAPYIGFPENPNVEELKTVWARSGHLHLKASTLLATLIRTEEEIDQLTHRLRYPSLDRDLIKFIVKYRNLASDSKPLWPYQYLLATTKIKKSVAKEYIIEVLKYNLSPYIQDMDKWELPQFPVGGKDLSEKSVPAGKIMGLVIEKLRNIWADSDFKLTGEQLLELLPSVLEEIEQAKRKK